MQFDYISDFHVEFNPIKGPSHIFLWGSTPKVGDWSQIAANPELIQGLNPFFYDWEANRKSNILVMAGDMSNDPRLSVLILNEAAKYYKRVLFVDGNHEHYVSTRSAYIKRKQHVGVNVEYLRDNVAKNVVYLDGEMTYQLDDVLFIGCNGWYDFKISTKYGRPMDRDEAFRAWKIMSNDSRILFAEGGMPHALAEKQADQLSDIVELSQSIDTIKKIVVVTHTIPIHKWSDPPLPAEWTQIDGAYTNTEMQRVLDADTGRKIKLWVYGHTHYHDDREYDGVRFLNHARGYIQEGTDWDGPLLVEV